MPITALRQHLGFGVTPVAKSPRGEESIYKMQSFFPPESGECRLGPGQEKLAGSDARKVKR